MILTYVLGCILFLFYISYYLFMVRISKRGIGICKDSNYSPKVSIIVPTYNEEATIKEKLANLLSQEYKGEVEIIIIDSASLDRTVEIAEKFCHEEGLKVIFLLEKERKGKAHALNHAFDYCTGDIVIMTDADARWETTTLSKALLNFSNPEIGAVTGRQVLLNPKQSVVTLREVIYRSIYETLRLGESVLDSTPIFHGSLACYRRSLLDKVSEDSMADDSELAVGVRKKGPRAISYPDAVFYEYTPPTFKSRFNQKVRRGQGIIQLFLRQWKLLFNPNYGKFGTIIFPAEFFMHMISPSLLLIFAVCVIYEFATINLFVIVGMAAIILLSALVLAWRKINIVNFTISFSDSQFILLIALFYQLIGKRQHKWQIITEVREF